MRGLLFVGLVAVVGCGKGGAGTTANSPPEPPENVVVMGHVNLLNQWSHSLEMQLPVEDQLAAARRAAESEENIRRLKAARADGIDRALKKYAEDLRKAEERLATAKAKAGSSGH